MWWTFVSNEASFTTVQKVKAMADMDLVVFGFDPSQLIDNFVTPFVHAFVANIHLRIEYPQEAEALR